ncbi:MAG: hypothetical protein JOZ69_23820, partial [Myxococcales bacterium]|nr:hypothetical protein [Myxococcales bacterium]
MLPAGEVRASAGFSANVAALGLSDATGAARREAAAPPGGGPSPARAPDETFARGVLVAASVAPGLAPFAGARVGIADAFEGGLAYTGRAVRADVRRAFDLAPHWALSLGIAGSAALYGNQPSDPLPDVDLARVRGWGGDVPLLVGYDSDGGLYAAWLGAR